MIKIFSEIEKIEIELKALVSRKEKLVKKMQDHCKHSLVREGYEEPDGYGGSNWRKDDYQICEICGFHQKDF